MYDERESGDDGDEDHKVEQQAGKTVVHRVSAKQERKNRKAATAAELAMNHVNTNRVVGDNKQEREQARTAAAARKAKNKADNAADKDKKAAAKAVRQAKAAKQERRA